MISPPSPFDTIDVTLCLMLLRHAAPFMPPIFSIFSRLMFAMPYGAALAARFRAALVFRLIIARRCVLSLAYY